MRTLLKANYRWQQRTILQFAIPSKKYFLSGFQKEAWNIGMIRNCFILFSLYSPARRCLAFYALSDIMTL
jgi:hypothetical protein